MDVENFEIHVLKGATHLIERCKPLIYIELWDNENRKACMQFLKIKAILLKCGKTGAYSLLIPRFTPNITFFSPRPELPFLGNYDLAS